MLFLCFVSNNIKSWSFFLIWGAHFRRSKLALPNTLPTCSVHSQQRGGFCSQSSLPVVARAIHCTKAFPHTGAIGVYPIHSHTKGSSHLIFRYHIRKSGTAIARRDVCFLGGQPDQKNLQRPTSSLVEMEAMHGKEITPYKELTRSDLFSDMFWLF